LCNPVFWFIAIETFATAYVSVLPLPSSLFINGTRFSDPEDAEADILGLCGSLLMDGRGLVKSALGFTDENILEG